MSNKAQFRFVEHIETLVQFTFEEPIETLIQLRFEEHTVRIRGTH